MSAVPYLASAADTSPGGGAATTPPRDELDIVIEQLDVFSRDGVAHRVWAEGAKLAVDYIEGRQWSEADRRQLEGEGRPVVTKNRIGPLYRLILGYARQNRYDIRYMQGADAASTAEIAEALTHVAKSVDERTQAKWKEAEIFADGMAAGRGYFDIRVGYEDNALGEIVLRRLDPFSVYVDCDADEYEPTTWNRVTVNYYRSFEDIALLFGGKTGQELWERRAQRSSVLSDADVDETDEVVPPRFFGLSDMLRDVPDRWARLGGLSRGIMTSPIEHVDRQRRMLRVLDRQHKKLKRCRVAIDVDTGDQVVLPDEWSQQRIAAVLQSMSAMGYRVTVTDAIRQAWRWTVTCGDTLLWDGWSPYQTPTVVPFFPYFRGGTTRGFADDLIDSQREINKRASAFLHNIMVSSNSGWTYEKNSIDEDTKQALETDGARAGLILPHEKGTKPPQRIQPAVPPQGFRILERDAQDDLKEISGVNDSALGNLDRVQSGRAIEARQRQAIVAHEVAFDNMSRTRELRGRKYLELIQGWYTQARLIRIIGEDSREVQTWINRRNATGAIENDLTLGRYLVAVDEASASATFLEGQFSEFMELAKMGLIPPDMADIGIDLSSMPRKEEIKARLMQARQMQQMQAGMPPPSGALPGGPGPAPSAGGPMAGPPAPPPAGVMPPPGGPPQQMPMPPGPTAGRPIPPVVTGPMGAPMRRPMPS